MLFREDAKHVMKLEIFPCSNGKRCYIRDLFVPTNVHRELALPVLECDTLDPNKGTVNRLHV